MEEAHHLHDLRPFCEKSLQGAPSLRNAIHAGLELVCLCFLETFGSIHAWEHVGVLDQHWRDFREKIRASGKISEGEEVESVSAWFDEDANDGWIQDMP